MKVSLSQPVAKVLNLSSFFPGQLAVMGPRKRLAVRERPSRGVERRSKARFDTAQPSSLATPSSPLQRG